MTDWHAHDTASMWRMVSNQDTSAHWRHVSGLRKIVELTATHLARLRTYRDNLAAAWAPSPASAAFLNRLDYLISHVEATHRVAAANYGTLATATTTLQAARTSLGALHGEWLSARAQLRTHEEAVAFQRASQLPGTTIFPPAVTDHDLERINVRARAVMADLSATLVQARAQLQQPTPYVPPAMDKRDVGSIYGGKPAPRIPSIESKAPPSSNGTPQLPAAHRSVGIDSSSGKPAPHARFPAAAKPAGSAASQPGLPTQESPRLGLLKPPNASDVHPGGAGRTRASGIGPLPPTPTNPMPPGGVIGGRSAASASRPTAGVNPVGGVIGPPIVGNARLAPAAPSSYGPVTPYNASLPAKPGANDRSARLRGPSGSIGGTEQWRRSGTSENLDGAPPGVTGVRRTDGGSVGSPFRPASPQPYPVGVDTGYDHDDTWPIARGTPPVIEPAQVNAPINPGPVIGLDP